MANPYPIEIQDESGVERLVGEATFTDPGNQPGGVPDLAAVLNEGHSTGAAVITDITQLYANPNTPATLNGPNDIGQSLAWSDNGAAAELGFFGAAPIVKPTVNNATTADIITALASLGLIIDGT